MNYKRTNEISDIIGGNETPGIEHNLIAGAKKTINGLGVLDFAGNTTAVVVGAGAWMAVANISTTTVRYVTVGVSSVSAGTSPAAKTYPIMPASWLMLCLPEDSTHAITNHADANIYLLRDNSKLVNNVSK